jgi:hypothetical protein
LIKVDDRFKTEALTAKAIDSRWEKVARQRSSRRMFMGKKPSEETKSRIFAEERASR